MDPLNENGAAPRPVRVLEVVGNGIDGGMESTVRNLIRHLPCGRFQVTCLCPYESAFTAAVREAGCEVFITPLRDDPPWQSLQFAAQLVRARRIDVIHAHLPNAHALTGLVGRLMRIPALATIHGMKIPPLELSVSHLTGTTLIVVCQAAYAEALALGVPPERLHLVPNGVDGDTFRPGRSGDPFRRALGLPRDAPLVGFVGRLAAEKGPDQIVRVADLVRQQRPDAHFALVGDGPLGEKMSALIRARRLQTRVHLASLWANIWDVYPAFDVFVQTPRSEGMPLVVLEAMACSRPVVAMDVGGVGELIEVGTTGLLTLPGDCGLLAEVLLSLLARPAQMRAMGQAGRRRVEDLFPLQTSVQRTGDVLRSLVTVRDSRAAARIGCGERTKMEPQNKPDRDETEKPQPREHGAMS